MVQRLTAVVMTALTALMLLAAPVEAKSQPPSLSITGGHLAFCCQLPEARTLTVTNDGGRATGTVSVTLTFIAGDAFAITKDGCTGKSLGSGKTCPIEVTWLVGIDTSATVTVASEHATASVVINGYSIP